MESYEKLVCVGTFSMHEHSVFTEGEILLGKVYTPRDFVFFEDELFVKFVGVCAVDNIGTEDEVESYFPYSCFAPLSILQKCRKNPFSLEVGDKGYTVKTDSN